MEMAAKTIIVTGASRGIKPNARVGIMLIALQALVSQ